MEPIPCPINAYIYTASLRRFPRLNRGKFPGLLESEKLFKLIVQLFRFPLNRVGSTADEFHNGHFTRKPMGLLVFQRPI